MANDDNHPKRVLAKTILAAIPPGAEYKSNDPPMPNNLFWLMTNTTHEYLLGEWRKEKSTLACTTACNNFVIWYGTKIGIQGIGNYFDLKRSLDSTHRGFAWVPSSPDPKIRPKYGDILRHTNFHVDVAIGFDEPCLLRVGAGMSYHPRPTKNVENEWDRLMRVHGGAAYNWQALVGWLDIALYFGSGTALPIPQWLLGWWTVTWRTQTFYYYFDASNKVRWTQNKWDNTTTNLPPGAPSDTGTFVVNEDGVSTKWDTTGSVERFWVLAGSNNCNMVGALNETDQLYAVKIGVTSPFGAWVP